MNKLNKLPENIPEKFILEFDKSPEQLNALTHERSQFFRDSVDINKKDFEYIDSKYHELVKKWQQLFVKKNRNAIIRGLDIDPEFDNGYSIIDRDMNRSGWSTYNFNNSQENIEKIKNILKALWYIDYFKDKKGYQQGDMFIIPIFLKLTNYNEIETFFLVLLFYYKNKWISLTNIRNANSYYYDLSFYAPIIQIFIKERPTFFKFLLDKNNDDIVKELESFITYFIRKPLIWKNIDNINTAKIIYNYIFKYGFEGWYTVLTGIFLIAIEKQDTISTFWTFNDPEGTGLYIDKITEMKNNEERITQEYLDKTRNTYFTENKLKTLVKKYNKIKGKFSSYDHDKTITFAPFKPKPRNFLSKVFRGGKNKTKYKWIKIKKNKTRKKYN